MGSTYGANIITKRENKARGFEKFFFRHTEIMLSRGVGGGGGRCENTELRGMGGVNFSFFFLTKISSTCHWFLWWCCRAWYEVSVLAVVVCLVVKLGEWLVGRISSGDGSHGLFSGLMRLAGSSFSLVFCLDRECPV